MKISNTLACALMVAGGALCGTAAAQQAYPVKPVRFIVTPPANLLQLRLVLLLLH